MSLLTYFAQASAYGSDYADLYGTSATPVSEGDVLAVLAGMFIFILIGAAIGYVVSSFLLMKLFKKAGVESWIAWVPIYNNWKIYELGGKEGYWAVLALVPIVNLVAAIYMYIAMYNINLKFGKSGAFFLLALFLYPVWLIILAFGSATWDGSKGAPSLAGGAANQPQQPQYGQVPQQPQYAQAPQQTQYAQAPQQPQYGQQPQPDAYQQQASAYPTAAPQPPAYPAQPPAPTDQVQPPVNNQPPFGQV